MDIRDLTSSGATPVLEKLMMFAGQRQRLIAHNIANFSTPNYRLQDVSPEAFQGVLRDAIDRRRARESGPAASGEVGEAGGAEGSASGSDDLVLESTDQIDANSDGSFALRPRTTGGGILYHDRNNRDLERTMQDLVENLTVFRVASDLLRSRYAMLNSAISERV